MLVNTDLIERSLREHADFIAYEHQYYDDETAGGRMRCWFVTYQPWEDYSFGKEKWVHIRTRHLKYIEKE